MTLRDPRELSRLRGLYAIVDDAPGWARDPVEQARAALGGGACAVQLRAKHATDSTVLDWAERIRALASSHGALLFVNDRFDLALAAEADGVHLGHEDLPPERIPKPLRERLWIGRSTHTLEQVHEACAEPVDYVAFGPVFATGSKHSPYPPRGIALLAEVAREVRPRPLVAIGGITEERVEDVIRAGADAVAVISALADAEDPVGASRRLAERARRAATP